MAFQQVYDMEQADELWALGLLYVKMGYDDCDWFLDDSYLGVYAGSSDWRPSKDETSNIYAIYIED